MIIVRLLILGLASLFIGCTAEGLVPDSSLESKATPAGVAAPLSLSEFQNLKPEKQYQVANKLAGTMYKGIPVDVFFDFNVYGDNLKVSEAGSQYLKNARAGLTSRLKNKTNYNNLIEARHDLGTDLQRAKALPLAILKEYPESRERFEVWMAYVLMNTILFSPAEELDSTNYIDIQIVFNTLVKKMSDDVNVSEIVLAHMKSEANWRRFRSPEDNVREMMEIYLGLFDRDEEVPRAAIACKNWYLTGENNEERYALIVNDFEENTQPQFVLGRWVTNCEDFYDAVAQSSRLIPQLTGHLVAWFFPNASEAKKANIVKDIVAQKPTRFNEIFTAIIFSREYLMNNERPKSFEENFFNLAERLAWEQTNTAFMRELTANSNANRDGLREMGQPTMTLKLGRPNGQPLDVLSFSYYHKTLREQLLARVGTVWGSWGDAFVDKGDLFETEDYIDYLFLAGLSRKATSEEMTVIKQAFVDSGNDAGGNYRSNQASIVFDYISRLPDLYYFKKITEGDAQ